MTTAASAVRSRVQVLTCVPIGMYEISLSSAACLQASGQMTLQHELEHTSFVRIHAWCASSRHV